MVRRKGELSKTMIDHGWPYQVALPERLSCREHWKPQHEFCAELSLCPRGHAFTRNSEWWNVRCFAEREHAEKFQRQFGGEFHDARMEPRSWRLGPRKRSS